MSGTLKVKHCAFCVLILFGLLPHFSSFAQNRQLSFSLDNDAFALQGKDGYYTGGGRLSYSYTSKKSSHAFSKTINTFQLSQKLFMPGRREIFAIVEIDRPITGYLSAAFSKTFFKHNQFFKAGLEAGAIGAASLGKQTLNLVHPFLQINQKYWDWMYEYQLKSEVGLNLSGSYGFTLLPQSERTILQISPVSKATLGSLFTYVSQSVVVQFGKQKPLEEGALWNGNIGTDQSAEKDHELFAYAEPTIMYQAYNATVQGGLLRSDKGRIVSNSKAIVWSNTVGALYAAHRYSLQLYLTFQRKEASSQLDDQWYGGFNVAYRF